MAEGTILVVGTSRRDGNTYGLVQRANKGVGFPVVDVSELRISFFDYHARNLEDDFIPTIEKLLRYDTIGLVSPVYWYSLSAQLKTFIDRFADLLGPRKDLGRQLKGKRLFLLATGSTDEQLPSCMEEMVRLTAGYMEMEYLGAHYARFLRELDFKPETVAGAARFLASMSCCEGGIPRHK